MPITRKELEKLVSSFEKVNNPKLTPEEKTRKNNEAAAKEGAILRTQKELSAR